MKKEILLEVRKTNRYFPSSTLPAECRHKHSISMHARIPKLEIFPCTYGYFQQRAKATNP
jgi:hypothetical protein